MPPTASQRAQAFQERQFATFASKARECLKQLLETKHLYQSLEVVPVPLNDLLRWATHEDLAPAQGQDAFQAQSNNWEITLPIARGAQPIRTSVETFPRLIQVDPPRPNCYCRNCRRVQPYALERANFPLQVSAPTGRPKARYDQFFILGYQCQGCADQSAPEIFLVGKTKNKLTLAGRLPMEAIAPPEVLPRDFSRHFSDALHAFNSGQTLPALFMLRVFIEQFARAKCPDRQNGGRGVDLMDSYNSTLPDGLKTGFPSLRLIYEKLSEAIHNASTEESLFEALRDEIVKHFEGRWAFRLDPRNDAASA